MRAHMSQMFRTSSNLLLLMDLYTLNYSDLVNQYGKASASRISSSRQLQHSGLQHRYRPSRRGAD